ncbi:hypothetical protein XA3_11780 [Xylocopilactobacillus apicola]|uniref:Transposase n=1 Tax=Xylocopilactobacillus apicola TaxID=2932184 RepID=A0AAU9DNR3_9LACO|nr:hypothetical protein XA3_11780 [Xylocopilactobacillus apicola]
MLPKNKIKCVFIPKVKKTIYDLSVHFLKFRIHKDQLNTVFFSIPKNLGVARIEEFRKPNKTA